MKTTVFFEVRTGDLNAASKAPGDVVEILKRECGAEAFTVPHKTYSATGRLLPRIWHWLKWQGVKLSVLCRFPRKSFVLFQGHFYFMYQMFGYRFLDFLMRVKGSRYAFLIHDMPGHMVGDDFAGTALPHGFVKMAEKSAGVIVHNEKMGEWFREGFEKAGAAGKVKIVNLECFDYLAEGEIAGRPEAGDWRKVVFAGNLMSKKAGFLDDLAAAGDVRFELYGAPERESRGNVVYKGSRRPGDLPAALGEGFGLVWDGDSIETCSGGSGAYLKYNHPHKLSLYLASGMPVVIWSGAAQAALVEKYAAGIAIASLKDLPARLSSMSEAEYLRLRAGAVRLGALLRAGHFTRRAWEIVKS